MKTGNINEILDIAINAGVLILQNGGETYRAEDTMTNIARSHGSFNSSCFVTPTVVMITCIDEGGHSYTRIQRISERTINLGKIARVNAISRRLREKKTIDSRSTRYLLERVNARKNHKPAYLVVSTAITSFAFSLLFSGTFVEACCAFCIGAIMRLCLFLLQPLRLSSFLHSVVGSTVITLLSGVAVSFGFVASSGNITISCLMSLVPGVAIVNAIRDSIAGDLVAGSARILEAVIVAAALSIGAAFGLVLISADASWLQSHLSMDAPFLAFMWAFIATASFAFYFHITRYDILSAAFIGASGWLSFVAFSVCIGNGAAAYMFGAIIVGILAEIAAVIFKKPATVFIVPGIVPVVPGGGMYETMLLAVLGQTESASQKGFATLLAAGAIAVGIALASSLARLVARAKKIKLKSSLV